MSFFSRRFSNKKQRSHKSRSSNLRPKLSILATQPSISSQPLSSEWILDLCMPPGTTMPVPAVSSEAETPRHSIVTGLLPKHKKDSVTSMPSSETNEGETVTPEKHYYFSRLHHTSHVDERPKDITLQIFLTSFPTLANAESDHSGLLKHFSEALEAVHLTPDSNLWLRQALFALQKSEILPPVSHGLDVSKFMSFATSYLEHHVQGNNAETSDEVKEINYSKFLRENERLRNRVGSDDNGRTVVNVMESKSEEVAADEDIWNLPIRGKSTKAERGWGGFWISRGPGANPTTSESRGEDGESVLERRDVYGGLM